MKINKPSQSRKLAYILSFIVLVGILFATYFLLLKPKEDSNNQGVDYEAPTQEQVDAGNRAKTETIEIDQKAKTNEDSSTSSPESSNSFSIRITSTSVESGVVHIRNTIDGIHQDGTCSLTLSKDGQTVEKTAGIQPLPNNSTCKGFDIPVSELSNGTWQAMLSVTINGETAKATASVEV